MSDPNGLTWAATLVSLAVAIPTAGHAIIYKRDPRSATLWVLLIALLPLGGSLLYGLFGINRYQRRARRLFPGADHAVRQGLSPTMPEAVSPPADFFFLRLGLLSPFGGASATFAASGFSGSAGFAGGSWRSKTTRSALSSQRALA